MSLNRLNIWFCHMYQLVVGVDTAAATGIIFLSRYLSQLSVRSPSSQFTLMEKGHLAYSLSLLKGKGGWLSGGLTVLSVTNAASVIGWPYSCNASFMFYSVRKRSLAPLCNPTTRFIQASVVVAGSDSVAGKVPSFPLEAYQRQRQKGSQWLPLAVLGNQIDISVGEKGRQ